MATYPNLTPTIIASLRVIAKGLEDDPEYLTRRECPYPPDLQVILQRLSPTKIVREEGQTQKQQAFREETSSFKTEAESLYEELNSLDGEDTSISEKLRILTVKTRLLEKMIDLRERTERINDVKQFQDYVLKIMESTLTDTQKKSVMKHLKELAGETND